MGNAIAIRGLTKNFGSKVAVQDLDLDVPTGSLCGFIGPNGAGKTTTLRMILSILFPDRGELAVLGHPSALEAKDRIGYLPEERGLYRKMKVGAFLHYMARVRGVRDSQLGHRVRSWLERVDLPDVEHKRCEELSKGMQQKVQFLSAILHDPDLLIFDEPFSGLDPVNMRLLRDLIQEQNDNGKTVIFSTHVMHQAEQLCDRIFMIHHGRKMLDAGVAEIRARFDPRTLVVEPVNGHDGITTVRGIPGVRDVTSRDGALEVSLHEGQEPQAMLRAIVDALPVARIELRRPSLEDVFVQIVQDSGGEDEASLRAAVSEAGAPLGAGGVS